MECPAAVSSTQVVGKERPVSSGAKLIDEAEVKKPEEEVIDLEILFDLFVKRITWSLPCARCQRWCHHKDPHLKQVKAKAFICSNKNIIKAPKVKTKDSICNIKLTVAAHKVTGLAAKIGKERWRMQKTLSIQSTFRKQKRSKRRST